MVGKGRVRMKERRKGEKVGNKKKKSKKGKNEKGEIM